MNADFLELTNRMRRCRVCREWTYWAPRTAIRSDDGLCLTHADGYPCADAPTTTGAAIATIVATFGDIGIGTAPQMPAKRRTVVSGRWVGSARRWAVEAVTAAPCPDCGGPRLPYTRRPCCRACEHAKTIHKGEHHE